MIPILPTPAIDPVLEFYESNAERAAIADDLRRAGDLAEELARG
jgi:hypothetical protein